MKPPVSRNISQNNNERTKHFPAGKGFKEDLGMRGKQSRKGRGRGKEQEEGGK